MPSFTDLAKKLLADAEILDKYLVSEGRPTASFDEDCMEDLPPAVEEIRKSIIDGAQTTKRLALGSRGIYGEILFAASSPLHTGQGPHSRLAVYG